MGDIHKWKQKNSNKKKQCRPPSKKKKRGKNIRPRIKRACHSIIIALLQSIATFMATRHMPSIERGACSITETVDYAEYQSLIATAEKILSAARKLTGFEQHSPRAFERGAMCPVKLADMKNLFFRWSGQVAKSGGGTSGGLDRTHHQVVANYGMLR
jgi:hypothetical protein